ncbi:MAG: endonuclease/exonuclease/phosphatase family protein [Ilumatobacteraceae bacterium]
MTDTAWRVLTWNLRGSASPDLDVVADVISSYAPDAVALQEVRRAQAAALGARLGWHHTWARKHHPYSPLAPWLTEGLAIVSPHPLANVTRRSIAPGVSTWTYRHRIVLAATVQRDAETVRLYDTHLASGGGAADERIAQAARVAALINSENPPMAVAAGDLNDAGEIEVVREFHAAGLRDPGGGPTNPSIAPRNRLDHVLVPEAARVVEQQQPDGGEWWWAISDHVPALVAFTVAS